MEHASIYAIDFILHLSILELHVCGHESSQTGFSILSLSPLRGFFIVNKFFRFASSMFLFLSAATYSFSRLPGTKTFVDITFPSFLHMFTPMLYS